MNLTEYEKEIGKKKPQGGTKSDGMILFYKFDQGNLIHLHCNQQKLGREGVAVSIEELSPLQIFYSIFTTILKDRLLSSFFR